MVTGGDVVDGIYFYWIAWIGWVFTTFLMKKNQARSVISFLILFILIGSSSTFQFAGFTIRLSFLLLLFISFVVMAKIKGLKLYYYVFSSLIVTIGYVGFKLFELFDPVWLIFDRNWMLSFVIFYLILMLVKEFYNRLIIAIISISNGEILFALILKNFSIPIEIGEFQFFDVLAIIILLIALWRSLEKMAQYLEVNFTKGINERQG